MQCGVGACVRSIVMVLCLLLSEVRPSNTCSVSCLWKQMHSCSEELCQFSHVNKIAFDQYLLQQAAREVDGITELVD